mgnify:CR=1 FL=1
MNKLTKIPKVIIMFGGVYSSLGKGVAVSSIGRILTSYGFKVSVIKMDPYLNINPGNMAPGQHGEVYVTVDGAQTDLDLGNYERFIGRDLTQLSNLTSGRIYWDILHKEEKGGFGGKTVQVIPHVTDYIKNRVSEIAARDNPDFLLVEVGGTVGDIESVPFIEALSQLTSEWTINNVLSILLAPLISLGSTTGELKTKPAQHSIKTLRSSSIYPNMLILRTVKKVDDETKEKLALTTHMPIDGMFTAFDQKSVYDLPASFYEQKIHEYIFKYFNMNVDPAHDTFKQTWGKFFGKVSKLKKSINVALVGKYTKLHDAYASLIEALKFAGYENDVKVNLVWMPCDDIKPKDYAKTFKNIQAVVVPGGFGDRGTESMINILKCIRENHIPCLGICLGMQLMAIEYARNVLGWADSNSTEFSKNCQYPIYKMMDGNLRLGDQEVLINKNSVAANIYKAEKIKQRHRHRYGLIDPVYIKAFNEKGLIMSAISNYNNLTVAEFSELPTNKCYIGCQFHPEFHSRPKETDPIFTYLIKKGLESKK